MTPDEFGSARKRLGLTQEQLAALLGYRGSPQSRRVIISRFENGHRLIPPQVVIIMGQLLEVKRQKPK